MKLRKTISGMLAALILMGTMTFGVKGAEKSELCSYPTDIGKRSAYDSVEESPLYKRNILFFGDSLCRARSDEEYSGYAGRIGEKYSMAWKNYGASGYALSRAKGSNTILTTVQNGYGDNLMREEPLPYDLIVLEGGVNDAWVDAPLGEISDSFEYRDFDRDTFAGGMEATICRAKEYFPEATVCFILMYRMPKAQWMNDDKIYEPVLGVQNMDEYVAMQRQILEKWNVPYLDLYGDESFNRDVFKVETTTYLANDYVHMQGVGYILLFQYIAAWLETLPLPERLPLESESDTEAESETEAVSDSEGESEPTVADLSENSKLPAVWIAVGAAAVAIAAGGCGWLVFSKRKGKKTK